MIDPVVSGAEHGRLKDLSLAVFKNGSLLPVAVAFDRLAPTDGSVAAVPAVGVGLAGRLTANRIVESLERLSRIGAAVELPHPGAPAPRVFERRPSPFWAFMDAYCFAETGEASPGDITENAGASTRGRASSGSPADATQ